MRLFTCKLHLYPSTKQKLSKKLLFKAEKQAIKDWTWNMVIINLTKLAFKNSKIILGNFSILSSLFSNFLYAHFLWY